MLKPKAGIFRGPKDSPLITIEYLTLLKAFENPTQWALCVFKTCENQVTQLGSQNGFGGMSLYTLPKATQ